MAWCVSFTFRKKKIETAKETTTVKVPIVPESVFPIFFPKKTLNKNPIKGDNSKTKAKLVSIKLSFYIANPTATSAAATAIEKNTKTCPWASW